MGEREDTYRKLFIQKSVTSLIACFVGIFALLWFFSNDSVSAQYILITSLLFTGIFHIFYIPVNWYRLKKQLYK